MAEYKAVRVEAGRGGWGGPLTIKPTAERSLIYSVTGGGIHPVAQKIADLTGARPSMASRVTRRSTRSPWPSSTAAARPGWASTR
jgi:sorbitol-specific phosphotransferase system component IIBC